MFHKKQFFVLTTLLLTCFLVSSFIEAADTETQETAHFLSFLDISVSGTYTGDLNYSQPDGSGTFVSTSSPTLTVSGMWKEGVLVGENTIFFPDDHSSITATFKNGLMEGTVTWTYEDDSYATFRCREGVPASKFSHYSKTKKLLDVDWFYNSSLISSLEKKASVPDYTALLSDPNTYLDLPMKIEGTVKEIYDDSRQTYLKVQDKNGHPYLCQYTNMIGSANTQAHVPNLQKSEKVVLYGFFEESTVFDTTNFCKSTVYSENALSREEYNNIPLLNSNFALLPSYETPQVLDHDFENTLPVFTLFSGYAVGETFNPARLSFEYEEIVRYPYEYFAGTHSLKGTVLREYINYEAENISMMIKEEDTSHLYYCTYDLKKDSVLPCVGDTISLKGVLKGNHKISVYDPAAETNTYTIYPRMYITAIQ